MEECVFCKIVRGEVKADVVKASNNFIAFKDINPAVPGHTIVVPKKHFVTFLDLPQNLAEEMMKMIKEVASSMLEKKIGDGFNLVMNNLEPAGQVVPHAHVHVLPRKEGDGLRFLAKT